MLKLINGKFYRDNIEERPEIFNQEQIDLVKAKQAHLDELHTGMNVWPEEFDDISAEVNFACKCEALVTLVKVWPQYEFIEDVFNKEKVMCKRCSTRYEFLINDEKELIVKIK